MTENGETQPSPMDLTPANQEKQPTGPPRDTLPAEMAHGILVFETREGRVAITAYGERAQDLATVLGMLETAHRELLLHWQQRHNLVLPKIAQDLQGIEKGLQQVVQAQQGILSVLTEMSKVLTALGRAITSPASEQ